MEREHIIKGYGPLDVFLAKQRYKIAHRELRAVDKNGWILDIGCGSKPMFLSNVEVAQRYGLDKNIEPVAVEKAREQGIELANFNFDSEQEMPFEDNYFDAVTMLAVFEHIEPERLAPIHSEIRRILKSGGLYIMTTPAFWTDPILRCLARLHLISDVSIKEHQDNYRHSDIARVLAQAGFEKSKMRFGYFELLMNSWVTALK